MNYKYTDREKLKMLRIKFRRLESYYENIVQDNNKQLKLIIKLNWENEKFEKEIDNLRSKLLNKKKLGFVLWFDNPSGEGMIMCPSDKSSYYVHWSAIKYGVAGAKTLEKNQPVEFTLYRNLYMKQVDTIEALHFNFTVNHEHKLNQLMNEAFENSSCYIFDLADQYYKETK